MHVVVDPILCNILRPHQREVIVKFSFKPVNSVLRINIVSLTWFVVFYRELNLCMNV